MFANARKFTYLSAAKNSNKEYLTYGKVNINLRQSLLSEESITQARLFMRFHLTKSSTALLVFAAPPTTATSGTRLCQPCQTCSSVAVTAWKMSTEVSATCENHLKSGYRRATQSDVPYNHLKKYAPF